MNKFLTIFFLLPSLCLAKVILIDPGHGGDDLGARSRLSKKQTIYEKTLALDVAKRIQKYLKKTHTVYLSRSYDVTVGLAERAAKAEKIKADLVVSVHINSSTNALSNGVETYYLGNHKDEAIHKIEAEENKKVTGFNHVIQQILADLVVSKTVPQSKALAHAVHGSIMSRMQKKYKLKDRGIKPAIFYILALSKRPGILLEVGFMSNKKELKRMRSAKFKNQYAKAVAEGINQYLQKVTVDEVNLF